MSVTPERGRVCPAAQPHVHHHAHLPGGCRCRVDAAPTRQFVQSLAVNGWPLVTQGRLLGAADGTKFRRILSQDSVERGTALRVARLWDRLWSVPGPCPRTVAWAVRHGWTAPDWVVVARLVAGIACPHTDADRDQAIRLLAAQGRSVTTIVNRLHTSARKVRAATNSSTAAGAVAA